VKISLVNPPAYLIHEPRYDTPPFTRLALACLAGYLREQGDYTCQLVDAKFERLNEEQTLNRILDFHPQVVGLTAFTNEIKPAHQIAQALKARRPELVILIGGIHVSALPEATLEEFPCFDYGCVGEGEITLKEFCETLQKGFSLDGVPGLVYRKESQIFKTPPRLPIADQNSLPLPAWDLLPQGQEWLIMSSRGCPFICNFCMNPNGRLVRPRTPEHLLSEILYLQQNYGAQDFWFCDEIFTVNRRRTVAICEAILKEGLEKKIRWFAQTHVACVDEELLVLMKKAGCYRVGLGIETGDEEKLKVMGKKTDLEKILKARQAAVKADLPVECYFIIGQPYETLKSAKMTIDFAIQLNPDIPIFGIMVPYPGTKVAEMAARGEGGYQLRSQDWNDFNKQLGNALEFKHLSRWDLERIQALGYLKVFLYNRRYLDLLRFIWKYQVEARQVLKNLILKPFYPPLHFIQESSSLSS
jgi:anaerobic magnesium-protoporphyrin IX monomethyl ester cyclase